MHTTASQIYKYIIIIILIHFCISKQSTSLTKLQNPNFNFICENSFFS